jgi:hypothetical protein
MSHICHLQARKPGKVLKVPFSPSEKGQRSWSSDVRGQEKMTFQFQKGEKCVLPSPFFLSIQYIG